MDLNTTAPRSAKDKLLGLVSLKRAIDKAKAYNAGKLGEYHYDCPHDKPLFEFLGIDAASFAAKVAALQSDERIADWIDRERIGAKSAKDIEAFNQWRYQWHPEPGSDSEKFFIQEREKVAPGRADVVTWFDLLDLDEGRPVQQATRLPQTAKA